MTNSTKKSIVLMAVLMALLSILPLQAFAADSASKKDAALDVDFGGLLRISEVMIKNSATLLSEDGRFADWIELENISNKELPLRGWTLSDREDRAKLPLPDETMAPGELRVFFCGEESFSLSKGETLYLFTPSGEIAEALDCNAGADCSLQRLPDGNWEETAWPSPGYPNGTIGYCEWSETRQVRSPVRINEIMVSNRTLPPSMLTMYDPADWVELYNAGNEAFSLAGCMFSDRFDKPDRWVFPEVTLAPGEHLLVYFDDEPSGDYQPFYCNTGFALAADRETLYLFAADGSLMDYVSLHDIPLDGSTGRTREENGFFYFTAPTPGKENGVGARTVSPRPVTAEPDGVFEGVENVCVTLLGEGEIHYTLDGSLPTENSPLYEQPLLLDSTAIVRAVAWAQNAAPSPCATFTYVINEGHTLPILSLAVDDPRAFKSMYDSGSKGIALDANLALYENGVTRFNQRCDVGMRGGASLGEIKKSLGVRFKARYGGHLFCDVFDNGLEEYSSLTLRVGQDFLKSIIRNEVMQDLALESEYLLSQESKYCILYVNSRYYGIFCLKEDFSRFYYASHTGVSEDSVEAVRFPSSYDSAFYQDVIARIYSEPMTEELYRELCEEVDMDSLIDWFLFEGVSANVDTHYNLRAYRSPENGGRWAFAFYDLDWALMFKPADFLNLIYYGAEPGNHGPQMPALLKALSYQPEWRERCINRYLELRETTLNNERLLERIDYYTALLKPEIDRNQTRWWLDSLSWEISVKDLCDFITGNDWENHNIASFCQALRLTNEEREIYFGTMQSS